MTHQVPVTGFNVPLNEPAVQPSTATPGFTQTQTPVATPAHGTTAQGGQQAPVNQTPAPTDDGLAAAVTALLAALPSAKPEDAQQVQVQAQVDKASLNNFDVDTLEDPILRGMAVAMQTAAAGLDLDRVLGKALETGNAEFIDVAYIKEHGKGNADAIIMMAEGIIQKVSDAANESTKLIHELAGGAANWDASVAAFNAKAPREIKLVVQHLINTGVRSSIEAGGKLVVQFAKNTGMLPYANPLVAQGGAGLNSAQALSKDTFQTELRKLDPYAKSFESERAALFARRKMGQTLGM